VTNADDQLAYARERERAERAAAKAARTPEARQAHERLADLYAKTLRQLPVAATEHSNDDTALPRIVILKGD
jgi:hypothetical protein